MAVIAIVGLVFAAGCSASFSIGGETVEDAAMDLIEGELAEQLELPLTADCPEVAEPDVGTEFSCTATTEDGKLVTIAGLVDREDHIDLETTNVVRGPVVEEIARTIESEVADEGGGSITLDCGATTVVLDDDGGYVCDLDGDGTSTGATVDVVITDFDSGAYEYQLNGYEPPFEPGALAAELIETQLATQLGLTMTATCPTDVATEIGTTFECTALTDDDESVDIAVVVDAESHIDAQTLNVVRLEIVQQFAEAGAGVLEPQTGEVVIDCGDKAKVLNDRDEFTCDIASPDGTEMAIARFQITDFESLAFTVVVE